MIQGCASKSRLRNLLAHICITPILRLSISIAAHWDTGVTLRHALHSRHAWHTGHILYRRSASKIGCAVGTEGPTKFQQTFALGTRAFHLLAARGADLEIRLYTRMAIVACLTLGHLSKQRFLFQLALVNLSERLTGPQNHVDEETAYEEDRYQQSCENLHQQVL